MNKRNLKEASINIKWLRAKHDVIDSTRALLHDIPLVKSLKMIYWVSIDRQFVKSVFKRIYICLTETQ